MNRARKGQDLFLEKADYRQFVELLQETVQLFNINVAAYCLMPNHYHLLVQSPDANLSRCMRHLNGVYTQKYNATHSCDGTLFRGRYKSILIDADTYLLQLVRYIHRNPLKAGLVKRLDQYAWSSHKGYLSNTGKWDWLYKGFVLEMLTTKNNRQIQAYRQFMGQPQDDGLVRVLDGQRFPSMFGSERFISWVKDRFYKKKKDKAIPASKELAPDPDAIISVVCRYFKAKPADLRNVRRGVTNEPRDVAMYLMRSMRADSLMSIGENFGLNQYSSVSSAVMRVKVKMNKSSKLKNRLERIERDILKGQT